MDLANDDRIRKLVEQIQIEKDGQNVIQMAGELVRLLDQKNKKTVGSELATPKSDVHKII